MKPGRLGLKVLGRGSGLDEAIFFHRRLRDQKLPFGGAIVNRLHEGAEVDGEVSDDLEALLGEELGAKVARNFEDHRRLAAHDAEQVKRLQRELGKRSTLIAVPLLDDDVHDVSGLAELDEYLFATEYVEA
jgi:hypothetical protein